MTFRITAPALWVVGVERARDCGFNVSIAAAGRERSHASEVISRVYQAVGSEGQTRWSARDFDRERELDVGV